MLESFSWYERCISKIYMKHLKNSILILLFFLGNIAFSGEIYLEKDGKLNYEYVSLAQNESISKGDKIFVTKDKYYIVKKMLGRGNTTIIFQVIDPSNDKNYALRLPFPSERFNLRNSINYLNGYIDGHKIIVKNNIPVVEMKEGKASSYVLMEVVQHDFDLFQFLTTPESIDSSIRKNAREALLEFAKKTAYISSIGDFHQGQIVYNEYEDKWILLDWTNHLSKVRHMNAPLLFSPKVFKQNHYVRGERGDPVVKKGIFFNSYKKRDLTRREIGIYEDLERVVYKERAIQFNEDLGYANSLIELIESEMDTTKLLALYKERPRFYFSTLDQKMGEHFLEYGLPFLIERGTHLREIISLLNYIMIVGNDNFIELLEKTLPLVVTLKDFSDLFKDESLIFYSEENLKKLNLVIRENIDNILNNSIDSEENRSIARKFLDILYLDSKTKRKIARKFNLSLSDSSSCLQKLMALIRL